MKVSMQKKVLLLVFCFSMLGGVNVSAINKSGNTGPQLGDFEEMQELARRFFADAPPPESRRPSSFSLPLTVSIANDKGLIQEDKWYWVSPGDLSYKIGPNDIYEKYQHSEIYEEPQQSTTAMQFIRVGEKYLPFLQLGYVTLSGRKIDPESLRNLPHYLEMLKTQRAVYIDAFSGEMISLRKAVFSCCYTFIKMVDEKPQVLEIVRVLGSATVYSYYPSGHLQGRKIYHYQYEAGEANRGFTVSGQTYADSDRSEVLEGFRTTPIALEDIAEEALIPLFAENQKIPSQFILDRRR
jgi:hypothetical protein